MTSPATICWNCSRMLSVDDGEQPRLGDLCFCRSCGALAVIGPDLSMEPPNDELLELMASDPELRDRCVRFMQDRLRLLRLMARLNERSSDQGG